MSKLSQLEWFQQLGLPTAAFTSVSFEAFKEDKWSSKNLRFPLAVRSTYEEEDGDEKSYAGNFHTELNVTKAQLPEAIQNVFNSYPRAEANKVILQEMVQAEYSGVLFAFRKGVWKLELVEGMGEQLVSGQKNPIALLLPKFHQTDLLWSKLFSYWKPNDEIIQKVKKGLLQLSIYTSKLLKNSSADNGLDIEFAIAKGKLILLQARPITTAEEVEEVLTSANHKEILPPYPSRLMSSIIGQSADELFAYYLSLDSNLIPRSFIKEAAGMPWLNLSALLDIMVSWGLPTRLVCDSVGADDFYRVPLRPYRFIANLPVFFRVLWQQRRVQKEVKNWIADTKNQLPNRLVERKQVWEKDAEKALDLWQRDFQNTYVQLVQFMQTLTGAMSGNVNLLNKLGWLHYVASTHKSKSSDYLQAFQQLLGGTLSKKRFLEQYGHRGFYESDLGQKRFHEYSEKEWQQLLQTTPTNKRRTSQKSIKASLIAFVFQSTSRLIHTREWLRHESMHFFDRYRQELKTQLQQRYGRDFLSFAYPIEDLHDLLQGKISLAELKQKIYPEQSGWDKDSFLANSMGRRLPVPGTHRSSEEKKVGIGIYPGKIRGQIWRVQSANFEKMEMPPFEKIILLADALDPGWIPFFTKVDGVLSYVGGLLSHASIILRESQIPSITQLPKQLSFQTGDWVEIDGKTGTVKLIED